MKKIVSTAINCFFVSTLLMSNLKAQTPPGGDSVGGGGEVEEIRVDEIRSDILKWIKNGGHKSLRLPLGVSYEDYANKMTSILVPQAVTVSFVTAREEEVSNDPELKVTVNGKKKTCRGFISQRDNKPNILCNLERFNTTLEAHQYPLIHHEFAGLVRLEKNEGAASDYEISNQMTEYLVFETVLRLGIKTPPLPPKNCVVYYWQKPLTGTVSVNDINNYGTILADLVKNELTKKGYQVMHIHYEPERVFYEGQQLFTVRQAEYESSFFSGLKFGYVFSKVHEQNQWVELGSKSGFTIKNMKKKSAQIMNDLPTCR